MACALTEPGLGFLWRGDPPNRHDRLAGGGRADPLVNVEEGCRSEMHVRHMVFQAVGKVALAVGEIVEAAVSGERRGNSRRLVGIDATCDALVARHLEADHELLAARRANCGAYLFEEAYAILQRTAVAVGTLVRPW